MIEYPTIINSSKAPRKHGVAFDKLDGSNIRVKWTQKNGFCLFGSRHQLLDASHPHLGEVVELFNKNSAPQLDDFFRSEKEFRNQREIITYSEFLGEKSFAGLHVPGDPKKIVLFDVLVGHKNRYFVPPIEFIEMFGGLVAIPKVVYIGKLNDEFIQQVRDNVFDLNEGVIFKGTEKSGAFRGNIWSCKIKTQNYFDRLKDRFEEGWEKYGE